MKPSDEVRVALLRRLIGTPETVLADNVALAREGNPWLCGSDYVALMRMFARLSDERASRCHAQ